MTYKIPISGGPHTGKSTLMEALRKDYPDAHFVPEPAEYIIKVEKAHAAADASYYPVLPHTRFAAFSRIAVRMSVLLEGEIPPHQALAFQDRSLIDNQAYRDMHHMRDPSDRLAERIAAANYAFAFFCEPVGTYKKSLIRSESPEQAARTHEFLRTAYDRSGLPIVELPSFGEYDKQTGIEMRLAIIGQTLAELDIAA